MSTKESNIRDETIDIDKIRENYDFFGTQGRYYNEKYDLTISKSGSCFIGNMDRWSCSYNVYCKKYWILEFTLFCDKFGSYVELYNCDESPSNITGDLHDTDEFNKFITMLAEYSEKIINMYIEIKKTFNVNILSGLRSYWFKDYNMLLDIDIDGALLLYNRTNVNKRLIGKYVSVEELVSNNKHLEMSFIQKMINKFCL